MGISVHVLYERNQLYLNYECKFKKHKCELVTCDKKNINLRSCVSIKVHSAYPFRHFRVLELFVLSLLRKKIIIHFFNY